MKSKQNKYIDNKLLLVKKFLTIISMVFLLISLFLIPIFANENEYSFKWESDYYFHNWDTQQGVYDGFTYKIYSNSSARVSAEVNGENSFATVCAYDNPIEDKSKWTNVTIPESINGIPVKYIEHDSRYLWETYEITIPEGVIGISDYSFRHAEVFYVDNYIKTINLPSSLKYIGRSAFSGTDLVILPECQLENIEEDAFYNIGNEEFTIPKCVNHISSGAFSSCSNLKKVIFLGDTISVDDDAFYGYASVTPIESVESDSLISFKGNFEKVFGSVYYKHYNNNENLILGKILILFADNTKNTYDIPEGIVTIYKNAFANSKLESVNMPSTLKTIGANAFQSCHTLHTVNLNEGLEMIYEQAFYECISLKNIKFPKSLLEIGKESFFYNKSLTEAKFNDNLCVIGEAAFQDCFSLSNVTIPENVYKIGNYAFYGCPLQPLTIMSKTIEIGDYALGYIYNAETDEYEVDPQFTISSFADTTANQYAVSFGVGFIALDEEKLVGNNVVGQENLNINESSDSENDNTNGIFVVILLLLTGIIVVLLGSIMIIKKFKPDLYDALKCKFISAKK